MQKIRYGPYTLYWSYDSMISEAFYGSGKECRPSSDAAFCVWSRYILFAQTCLSEILG